MVKKFSSHQKVMQFKKSRRPVKNKCHMEKNMVKACKKIIAMRFFCLDIPGHLVNRRGSTKTSDNTLHA